MFAMTSEVIVTKKKQFKYMTPDAQVNVRGHYGDSLKVKLGLSKACNQMVPIYNQLGVAFN